MHLEHTEPIYLLWDSYSFTQLGYNKTQIKIIFKKRIIQSNELAIKLEKYFQIPLVTESHDVPTYTEEVVTYRLRLQCLKYAPPPMP